jgi:hypothetical protein
MRIESPLVSQSQVESPKVIEKKELIANISNGDKLAEDEQIFLPSALGSSKTYSVSSLRAAVDYHAKVLTVAANNLQAAQNTAAIPRAFLDRFKAQYQG